MSFFKSEIINQIKLTETDYILELSSKTDVKDILPGQFYLLRHPSFFLGRPISVMNVNPKKNSILFAFTIRGFGTSMFSKLQKGDYLDIQGPLGNKAYQQKFEKEFTDASTLFIGGGIGIAPISSFISHFPNANALYGARTKEKLSILDYFPTRCDKEFQVTDDGSNGKKNLIIDEFKEILKTHTIQNIVICAPIIVMRQIGDFALENGIKTYVLWENHMGCGVGACMGCSIKTKTGMKRVCTHGPVFLYDNIKDFI